MGPIFPLLQLKGLSIEVRRGMAEGSGGVNTSLAVMEMEFLRLFSENY